MSQSRFRTATAGHFFSRGGGATFGYLARSARHFFTSSILFLATDTSIIRSRASYGCRGRTGGVVRPRGSLLSVTNCENSHWSANGRL
jgi:hypothetical protein